MAAVMPTKMMDPSINVFTPPDAAQAIQTPYGSLQLASSAFQQQALSLLGQTSASALMGGMPGVESEEEDDDDDDDDEDGGAKGKRKRSKSGKGAKKGVPSAGKGGASGSSAQASGDRDLHTGRRKIRIEFIEDDSRRHITFSKRKAGIMKKVLLLIVSQTGLVYTFTTPKLSPVVQQSAGRELIQSCLNAPEPGDSNSNNNNNIQGNADESHEAEDSRNESQQQDDLVGGDYASSFAQHLPQGLHHPGNNDLFHDPRNVMGQPTHMGNININMAHLQGLNYGGFPGHQMGLPDQAIQYGSYGL